MFKRLGRLTTKALGENSVGDSTNEEEAGAASSNSQGANQGAAGMVSVNKPRADLAVKAAPTPGADEMEGVDGVVSANMPGAVGEVA